MNKMTSIKVMTAAMGMTATLSHASIVIEHEFGIFSPCEGARATVVWMGSSAGYTGELSWVNTAEHGVNPVFWTNHSAAMNQEFEIDTRFAEGERVDFTYEIIRGGLDLFSTANPDDWDQFSINDEDPFNVIVGIEDIRLPGGDSDYNDAVFRVEFDCCDNPVTPTPGTLALLGAGGLMGVRRRR